MSSVKTYLAHGFDEAIIGMECMGEIPRVVYSTKLMIHILINRDGMTEDEAIEFLDFNVIGSYLGEGTPLYVNEMTAEDIRNYEFD
jgi:hypothetical protein